MEININTFIEQIEEEFDEDIKQGTLNPESILEDTIDLTSVNLLILLSLVKVEYNVALDAKELKNCKKLIDVYNVIKKKIS